ncbi:hypothetical protein PTTW11_11222 [Pyrenophora teres f. teres]|uniref:Uncharacterized protein n=1 Tax=Pyrenophora teres f. teres TaxID=97479 RepID=A0A6S6WGZ8_9PLEO|nr:hypothetical protein PTTW11_11222 [Pyrenophora teres f. teres]
MISALEPGFGKLESKEKHAKRKQIDRYVLQGEVILLMLARAPGLVVTASELVATPDYHTLRRNRHRSPVSKLNWIDNELIQASELYSETVQSIFGLMHQRSSKSILSLIMFGLSLSFVAFIQQPTPNRQTSHRVAPNLQTLVPSYQAPLYGPQSFGNNIEARANTAKRRRVSGNADLQTPAVCPIPIQQNSGSTTQSESQHSSSNISNHPEQQHNSPPIERRNVGSTFHIESENSLTGRKANGTAGSNNVGTIQTNTTANRDALPGPSTATTVDDLRRGGTDKHTIEDSTGNSMQLIVEHCSSESSPLDRACEQRLPSPTPTYTSTLNHIGLDFGAVITPRLNIFGRTGEECSKVFESSAPIRLSDYIDPEMVEGIREWETVWAPEET